MIGKLLLCYEAIIYNIVCVELLFESGISKYTPNFSPKGKIVLDESVNRQNEIERLNQLLQSLKSILTVLMYTRPHLLSFALSQ